MDHALHTERRRRLLALLVAVATASLLWLGSTALAGSSPAKLPAAKPVPAFTDYSRGKAQGDHDCPWKEQATNADV